MGPVGFDVEQQALIWAMWRRGDAIREMERTLGETLPRIRRYLRESGGIPPIPRRRRSVICPWSSVRRSHAGSQPACRHGRSPGASTDRRRRYRGRLPAMVAAMRTGHWSPTRPRSSGRGARNRASWPRTPSCGSWSPTSSTTIGHRSRSPSGCGGEFRGDAAMRVSHESIYRDLYMPSRKVFDASMFHCLRSERPIRRPRGKKRSHGRGQIRNMVSIRERPTEADARQVAGHWEGDLVFGARPSAVATLVDRATRYAMVVALPDGQQGRRGGPRVDRPHGSAADTPAAVVDLGPRQ